MKIEVGKSYKTSNGDVFHIEHKSSLPEHEGYPYLGFIRTSPYAKGGALFRFNEGGVSHHSVERVQLLPNKVKKEGWIGVFLPNSAYERYCSSAIYPSKEESDRQGKWFGKFIGSVKIEWEEEE